MFINRVAWSSVIPWITALLSTVPVDQGLPLEFSSIIVSNFSTTLSLSFHGKESCFLCFVNNSFVKKLEPDVCIIIRWVLCNCSFLSDQPFVCFSPMSLGEGFEGTHCLGSTQDSQTMEENHCCCRGHIQHGGGTLQTPRDCCNMQKIQGKNKVNLS